MSELCHVGWDSYRFVRYVLIMGLQQIFGGYTQRRGNGELGGVYILSVEMQSGWRGGICV